MKFSISSLMDHVKDDSVQLETRNIVSAERVKELTKKKLPQTVIQKKRSRVVLKFALAAAVVTLLAGSAVAVRNYGSIGRMEDNIHEDEHGSSHWLTLLDDIAAPDAPDTIQEYYLPTAYVNSDELVTFWIEHLQYDQKGEYAGGYLYAPLSSAPEERVKESPLLDTPTDVYYAWNLDDTEVWTSVSFYQRVAKHLKAGDSFINIGFDGHAELSPFELDGYQLYAFTAYFPDDAYGFGGTSRSWYWTDGNYLFELHCSIEVSEETMTEIFRSIQSVGSEIPYVAQAEEIRAKRQQAHLGDPPETYYYPTDLDALGMWQNGTGEAPNYRAFNFTPSDGKRVRELIVLQQFAETGLARVDRSPSWFDYDSSEVTTAELDGQTILCINYYQKGELAGRQWKYERGDLVLLVTTDAAISEETLEAFCRSLTLIDGNGR